MAYSINDTCIACGQCKETCPMEAINEGAPYTIDAEKCTSCGACSSSCPVEAIEAD